ncbi:hypothetical protein [Streptococcus sp. Marseille-P7376]|nr:hypothetical protein [Streptococcus sp. Marseille-P7376]
MQDILPMLSSLKDACFELSLYLTSLAICKLKELLGRLELAIVTGMEPRITNL